MNPHRRRSFSGGPRPDRAGVAANHGRVGGRLRRWGQTDPEPQPHETRALRATGDWALGWRGRWFRVSTRRRHVLLRDGRRSWDADYCWWNTDKVKFWRVVAGYGPLVDVDAAAAFYRAYDRRRRARRGRRR